MPRNITISFEDGTSHVYQNAPDDVSPDQVEARASKEFGKKVTALDGGRGVPESAKPAGAMDSFITGLKNSIPAQIGAGVYRGLRDVTDTALGAGASLADKLGGSGVRDAADTASQQGKAEFDQAYGKSTLAGVSRVGGNVLATWPVGGAIAAGLKTIPGVAAAAPNLLSSIRTNGMVAGTPQAGNVLAQLGNLGTRALGGGIVGATTAAAVDPTLSSAGTGAVIGGALPIVAKGIGAAGQWMGSTQAGQAVMNAFKSGGEKGASAAIRALGMEGREAELLGYLRSGGGEIVPGSKPTVAQALVGTPAENAAGVYERVVSKSPGGNKLLDAYSAQGAARKDALEAVAPTNALGVTQARSDLGTAITNIYRPEENRIRQSAGRMYNADVIDPQQAFKLTIPVDDMEAAAEKYLKSVSGQGGRAYEQLAGAKRIGEVAGPDVTRTVYQPTAGGAAKRVASEVTEAGPKVQAPVQWEDVQALRSSIGDAWDAARTTAGNRREASALKDMKEVLDNAINGTMMGKGGVAGDVVPPDVTAAWKAANQSWSNYMDRFHTGPAASLFKTREGIPLVDADKAANLFWNGAPGLENRVQAFRKLVDDNPAMLGQFKSMITTEGLSTQTKTAQELSAKFPAWVDQHITGLREALSPGELESVQRIAQDIQRALKAGVAGKGPGATSDTFQLGANALNGGLLDSTAAKVLSHKLPFGQAARSWGAEKIGQSRARNAAGFLSDAGEAQNMLMQLSQATGKSPNALQRLLENSDLTQLGYRSAPVMASGR